MKKLKLFPSVLMLALCVGILGIGIYAATPTNNVITGTITVNAANAGITVEVFKGTDTSVDPIGSDTGRASTRIALTGENAIKIDASEAENLSQVQAAVYTVRLSTTSNIKLVVDTETIEWRDGTTTTGTITDALKITKVHTPAATDTSTGLAYFNNDAGAYEIVCSINLTDLHEEDFTSELNMVINVHKLEDWVEMGNTGINGIDYLHLGEYPQAKSAETTGFEVTTEKFASYNEEAEKASEIGNLELDVYTKGGKKYVQVWDEFYEFQPLKWRILDITDTGEYKLMCDIIVMHLQYQAYWDDDANVVIDDETLEGVYPNNYEHSLLRKFMNETFYESAFTDVERALIQQTTVKNDDQSMGGTDPNNYSCKDTEDWIFALSYQELQSYDMGTVDAILSRQVKPSDFSCTGGDSIIIEQDILSEFGSKEAAISGIKGWFEEYNLTDEDAEKIYYGMIGSGHWFTRSPWSINCYTAYFVVYNGIIQANEITGVSDHFGCVPAMVVCL